MKWHKCTLVIKEVGTDLKQRNKKKTTIAIGITNNYPTPGLAPFTGLCINSVDFLLMQ